MTKSEYMALPTAKEMMQALQADPALRNDDEACAAFNRRAQEEFEARIKKAYAFVNHLYPSFQTSAENIISMASASSSAEYITSSRVL